MAASPGAIPSGQSGRVGRRLCCERQRDSVLVGVTGHGGAGGQHGVGDKLPLRRDADRRDGHFALPHFDLHFGQVDEEGAGGAAVLLEAFEHRAQLAKRRLFPARGGVLISQTFDADAAQDHFLQHRFAVVGDADCEGERRAFRLEPEAEHFGRFRWEHMGDPLGQVEVFAAVHRFAVRFAAGRDEGGRIGHMDPEQPVLAADGVIRVVAAFVIDGERGKMGQVGPLLVRQRPERAGRVLQADAGPARVRVHEQIPDAEPEQQRMGLLRRRLDVELLQKAAGGRFAECDLLDFTHGGQVFRQERAGTDPVDQFGPAPELFLLFPRGGERGFDLFARTRRDARLRPSR